MPKSLLAPPLALTVVWKNLLLRAGGSQPLGHKAKNLIKVTHHHCPKTHTRNSAFCFGGSQISPNLSKVLGPQVEALTEGVPPSGDSIPGSWLQVPRAPGNPIPLPPSNLGFPNPLVLGSQPPSHLCGLPDPWSGHRSPSLGWLPKVARRRAALAFPARRPGTHTVNPPRPLFG